MSRRLAVSFRTLLALCGLGSVAQAQVVPSQDLALNRFEPSFAGDPMLGTASPLSYGKAAAHFSATGDYAHNPLVLRRSDGSRISAVVGHQLFLHLNGTLALFDRLNLNVSVPIALYQAGKNPTYQNVTYSSPTSAAIGDVRFGGRVLLLGAEAAPFQVSIGGTIFVPTGLKGQFVTDGEVRGQPTLYVGGDLASRFSYAVHVGPEFRRPNGYSGTEQGTMLRWNAGATYLFAPETRFRGAIELNGGLLFDRVAGETSNMEVLGSLFHGIGSDVNLGAGIGTGLLGGVGTPDFRAVLSFTYTYRPVEVHRAPPDADRDGYDDTLDSCPNQPGKAATQWSEPGCPVPDTDGDGTLDSEDQCLKEAGPQSNHGCPTDEDGDGVPDEKDACPKEPGPTEHSPPGCPPDQDGDKIPDAVDACPSVPGVASDNPKEHGCPADTDHDKIPNETDACPNEVGLPNTDLAKNGCAEAVRVVGDEITIVQQVQFASGTALVKPESFGLLDEVAGVLQAHTEIQVVEVQGHTDNRGAKAYNLKLSQGRAESVRAALVERGVAPERLVARGFGQESPLESNTTEAGRTKNRRVVFKILPSDATPGAEVAP